MSSEKITFNLQDSKKISIAVYNIRSAIDDYNEEVVQYKKAAEQSNSTTVAHKGLLEIQRLDESITTSLATLNQRYPGWSTNNENYQELLTDIQKIQENTATITRESPNTAPTPGMPQEQTDTLDLKTTSDNKTQDLGRTPQRRRRTVAVNFASESIESEDREKKSRPKFTDQPVSFSESKQSLEEVKLNPAARIEKLLLNKVFDNTLKDKDPFLVLSELSNGFLLNKLRIFYRDLPLEDKGVFLIRFAPLCVQKANIFMLQTIAEVDNSTDLTCLKDSIKSLTHAEQVFAQRLLTIDSVGSEYKKRLIKQFVSYGNIAEEGGLLTMAQTDSRKPLPISPTLLSRDDDFGEYLEAIKAIKVRPVREIFTIAKTHWLTGIIEIDRQNRINFLLIDSLGNNIQENNQGSNAEENQHYFKEFAKVFPHGKMYHNSEKRQHSPLGCSVIALDDMRRLHSIEHYLGQGLFNYLEQQKTGVEIINPGHVEVAICRLPLAFHRIKQSGKLQSEIIDHRSPQERSLAINSKDETAEECLAQDFKKVVADGKKVNRRADTILRKIFTQNLNYLEARSDFEVMASMQRFTLQGFKSQKEIENKKVSGQGYRYMTSQSVPVQESSQGSTQQCHASFFVPSSASLSISSSPSSDTQYHPEILSDHYRPHTK